MVEFVSPVSKHHGQNFLAAVAVVWNDRRQHGVPKQLSVKLTYIVRYFAYVI